MGHLLHSNDSRSLPRVAYGDPAAAARVIADMIPEAISMAEALGEAEAAEHLAAALEVAERRVVQGASAAGFGRRASGA